MQPLDVSPELQSSVKLSSLDHVYAWARKRSLWPMLFGLACCAFEMVASTASRYDTARFGMETMGASPRQADLMIVNGTVTKKMAPLLVRLYNQMAEPKYVIAMGACAISGGPFKEGYNVVSGVDRLIPVDLYIPGCPPRPEALLHGILRLHARFDVEALNEVRALQSGRDLDISDTFTGPDPAPWRDLEGLAGPQETAATEKG